MDLQTIGASTASSIASRIVCYPLDTIAIQHASSTRLPIFSVPLTTYYRGMGTSIALVTPATCIYLMSYRSTKDYLKPYLGDSTLNFLASGTVSELVSSVIWTPLEVIKARLQISTTATEGKLLPNLREIYKHEGMRGFYRGYLMGLVVFIPYNAIWWTTYENTKKASPFYQPFAQAACGALAATGLSTLACHPMDLLKTRYQVSTSESVTTREGRGDDSKSVRNVLRNVLREKGWRGLYMGLGPRLMCGLPSSLISMSVFEYFNPDDNTRRDVVSDVGRGDMLES